MQCDCGENNRKAKARCVTLVTTTAPTKCAIQDSTNVSVTQILFVNNNREGREVCMPGIF